ncbi:MAG TPA: EamA/RhaT family transporter [Lachnospiraceae bacterium]|nr:EamA/RhaT family transporter [Lachnospiraceae bacterium]
MMKISEKDRSQPVLLLTVMIWGSLYVAGRVVLPHVPALFLLFLRFAVSSLLLLGIARLRRLGKIRREDRKELLLVGILGYFLSNAALLLGIQYANASFSSLINALSPIFISLFAMLFLGERMPKKDVASLGTAVAGAAVIIGNPGGGISGFGIFCCVFSLIVWSYTTVHIKRLAARYDPILVTGSGMGIAALFSLPSSLVFMRVTGTSVEITPSLLLPIAYICVVCTAVSHLLWNRALAKTEATYCASFYPVQPLTSMLLGILLLHEKLTVNFIIGAFLVLAAMLLHAIPEKHTFARTDSTVG